MFVDVAMKLDGLIAGLDKLTIFLYLVFALFVGGAVLWNILRNDKLTIMLIVASVVIYFGYGFLTCPI